MVKRTEAKCGSTYYGIESIYDIVNGKQINKRDKVDELRRLSRKKLLECICGCGMKLVLVAGDRGLREQHFRALSDDNKGNCTYNTEGKDSIDSRMLLGMWFRLKLGVNDIESRVPICRIDDTDRRYELSILARENNFALSYIRLRQNIDEEKIEVLENNNICVKVLYVVDVINSGCNGQLPEWLLKIQDRQGFVLYIKQSNRDYASAELITAYFERNIDGEWNEQIVSKAHLDDYYFNANNELCIAQDTVIKLAEKHKESYKHELELEAERRKAWIKEQEERFKKYVEDQKTREKRT